VTTTRARDASHALQATSDNRTAAHARTVVGGASPRDQLTLVEEGRPPLVDPARTTRPLGDRYVERDLLGSGGMGEVRLFEDAWIGRAVALKSLHEELTADAAARTRFLREIRVQGQLEHPSIVPVYDVGAADRGELFFTMRRVRGQTLSAVLEGIALGEDAQWARFTRRRLLSAFSRVCLAVHYAHTRGVLHRDLKPSNVMLGDFGEVYVLDWGVAKRIGASDDSAPSGEAAVDIESTGAGRLVGTVGYMAPEQARGAKQLDARTDVYALGTILFEILAGRPLVIASSAADALRAIIAGLDGRPGVAAPDADVAPELDGICARATAKAPDARFPTALALSEAIEGYLDGDRDLERRKELAQSYTLSARTLADRAEAPETPPEESESARLLSFREVLRALALAPEEEEAQALLTKLVLEPPRAMPPGAAVELASERATQRAEGAGLGARGFGSFLLAAPLMVLLGVRSWMLVGVGLGLVAIAAMFAWWMSKRRIVGVTAFAGLLVLSTLIVMIQATWLGPFVLLPTAAAVASSLFSLYIERRWRPWLLLAAIAMVLVPFAAELVPGWPPGFTFEPDAIVLHVRALDVPPGLTTFALLYTSVGYVLLPPIFLGRLRDTVRASEDRTFLQAWTLRRLFPKSTEGR
jgi:serine/threonine protein kinase